tara:strand:+ start:415 stop:645 length:231 start_codon:yes stop_codon:yes gene_type:complete
MGKMGKKNHRSNFLLYDAETNRLLNKWSDKLSLRKGDLIRNFVMKDLRELEAHEINGDEIVIDYRIISKKGSKKND